MTEPIDYEPILAVIEGGIDKARRDPKPEEPTPSDDYIAWVILRELHRNGWSIHRSSPPESAPH
jgi:hypothetical protein